MNFASDNVYGVHDNIIAAIAKSSAGAAAPYGNDEYSQAAQKQLEDLFERELRVFFVATGTAANALALGSVTPGYGAVFLSSTVRDAT